MILDLFGDSVFIWTLKEAKEHIAALTTVQKERRSYLLHEYSQLSGIQLIEDDFEEVDGVPQKSLEDIGR